ncbi:hypothetical protein [Variovorax sp.]|jgi:hypothetical protein|uniref:hypothetical protein n=1 Tax=Variovorax sp. TaxID=1871043 RepID=UPI0011F691AA|nr:hypothetical protein [Variovorax sp.]TAJ64049.1 MAG: hypothetical protein EPO53_13550 [Variovorax sp.]
MLRIKTKDPKALLKKFDDAIAQKISPKIDTWRKVASGAHKDKYTHTSADQKDLAFLEASVVDDDKADIHEVRFRVTFPAPAPKNAEYIYSYYHGHMLETIFSHFNNDITEVVASPYVKTKAK